MGKYRLRIKGKGTSWHEVEAPTVHKAKKKLVEGSFYAKQKGIIKDVVVRKGK